MTAPDIPTEFPTTGEDLRAWAAFLDTPVWDRFPESTTANAQEVYPGVGDPLSFDCNLIAIEHASRTFIDQAGLAGIMGQNDWPDVGYYPAYYGRPHINISAFREMVKYVPGGSPDALDEQLFGKTREAGEPSWQPGRHEQLIRLRTAAKVLPLVRRTPADLARNEDAVEDFMRRLQATDMAAWPDADLMAMLDRALRRNLRTTEIHSRVTLFSGSGLENLRAFLLAHDFDDVDATVAELNTGLRDIESAKPGREISRLGAFVRGDETLRRIFEGDPPAILTAIQRGGGRSVDVFRERFQGFLDTYGYRGVRELGLATHVWAQRPDSVIALIKSQAERQDAADPETELRVQEEKRERRTEAVEARLGVLQRRKFRGLLKAAHDGIAGRERAKSQWVRSTHSIRLIVREAGRRLVERGVLDEVDDVFYMRLRDLRQAMAGNPRPDMRALVAGYRKTKEVCERVATPERFVGRPDAWWRDDAGRVPAPLPSHNGLLRGIPVSPGRVTARARVIRELQDDIDLEPGEVLVCPFTDAAWTPLFFNAAAVVMDLGGPLSHGSTVAREYGLPAVVNVKNGTQLIRNGQRITVDGTKGEVELEPEHT
ncbi:MAG: PEP-utilizing enzyme [Dehalococcoidia bacterium]